MGITGGVAALVSIIAAFILTLNNQDTYQRDLVRARELMEKGRSKEAIDLVTNIDSSSPLYSQAQQLIDRSSADILKQAEKIYKESGDLNKAVVLTESIPERSTTTFQKARNLRYEWKRESEANQEHLRLANQAILEERWQDAISEANKISSTFFWKQQKNDIVKQAKSQIEAKKSKSNNTLTVDSKKSLQQPKYTQPKYTQPHLSVNTKSPSQIPASSQNSKTSNSPPENQSIEPPTSPIDSSSTATDTCNDSTSLSCTSDSPPENQSIEPPTSSIDSSSTATDTCNDSTSPSCSSDSLQEHQSIEPSTSSIDSSSTATDTCNDSTSPSCTSPSTDNGL